MASADDRGGAPVKLPGEKSFIVRWTQKNPKAVDAVLYFIFLVIFTLIVFNAQGQPTDSSPYYMISNIRKRWGEPFEQVTSAGDWFDYMTATFVPLTFPNRWYNGEPFEMDEFGWPGGHPETYKLLGAVSMRQVCICIYMPSKTAQTCTHTRTQDGMCARYIYTHVPFKTIYTHTCTHTHAHTRKHPQDDRACRLWP